MKSVISSVILILFSDNFKLIFKYDDEINFYNKLFKNKQTKIENHSSQLLFLFQQYFNDRPRAYKYLIII